jgi:hypothetical protein
MNLKTSFHRFGGIEFRWQGKEIAHMHGNGLLDVPFPSIVARALVAKGLTGVHHVYPDSGWTSFQIKASTNIEDCARLINWSLQLKKKEIKVDELLTFLKKHPGYEQGEN